MAGRRIRSRWVLLLALVSIGGLLCSCGGGDTSDTDAGADSSTSTTTYSIQPWTELRPSGQPDQVIVGFAGPDPAAGEGCEQSYEPEVTIDERDVVVILLKVPDPGAGLACPTGATEVPVDLGEPLGGRQIQEHSTGRRYQLVGEAFELVAESTPCGRTDCSTPSPTPAPCESDAYLQAVDTQIDGGIRLSGDERCDGSFLVLGIDTGSGGCPPTEGEASPCANVNMAYFVARDGAWMIVTYGDRMTCDSVEESTSILFPASLCG